jgi:hypothetical protein
VFAGKRDIGVGGQRAGLPAQGYHPRRVLACGGDCWYKLPKHGRLDIIALSLFMFQQHRGFHHERIAAAIDRLCIDGLRAGKSAR